MEGLDPIWYARMLWYQKKYNLILALATVIVAITGILQAVKLYELRVPELLIFFFVIIIFGALEFILIEIFTKPNF